MLQAALRDGTAERHCVFEVFARRLPDGRRYGVVAGTGRLLDALPHFRYDDERLAGLRSRGVLDERDLRLAGRLPVRRRHLRLRRGRGLLPRLTGAHRRGHLRRGGAARDAGAERSSTTTVPSPPPRPGWPTPPATGRASRWAPGAPTRSRRSRRPGRPTWPGSPRRPTWRPATGTACRPRAPRPIPGPCCTRRRPTPSGPRSRPSGSARRCSSTPTTSPRASRRPSRSPVRSSAPSASTRATSRCWPTRPGTSSTRSAPATPASCSPATSTSTRLAALATAPVDAYGVGTSVVTGSGAPDRRLRLQARRGRGPGGGQALGGQGRPTAAARPRCAGTGPPARPPRRSCAPRARRSARDGRPRAAAPGGPRRRACSTYRPWTSPAPTSGTVLTTLPWQGLALSRGEPAIPTTYEEPPT